MKKTKEEVTLALAGNPNVGKSTVFNALTGLHQHTGNWTGKTVETAVGFREENGKRYRLVDLPGTYSLMAHSAEEEVARDFLCFEAHDGVIAVCDATHLARNLGLVLQILEVEPHTVVVLNLMDEARRLHMDIDTEKLSLKLGIPIVEATATKGKGISEILSAFAKSFPEKSYTLTYGEPMETAISMMLPTLCEMPCAEHKKRFFALRLLEGDEAFLKACDARFQGAFSTEDVENSVKTARAYLAKKGIEAQDITEILATETMTQAEMLSRAVIKNDLRPVAFSKADRLLTSKAWGIPMMFLLLMLVFWLTVVGANYPSEWLSSLFGMLETPFYELLISLKLPLFFVEMLTFGLYRTLGWIVSVMLPPMLIFFPLFTILEDVGYLPRVAFNLDGAFCKCGACGKQGLTMCMGLGCNAVGVTGARIIDSPRERLLAILTNAFIPCNGRFPAMIAVASVFFAGVFHGNSWVTALVLALAILLGVMMTFLVSWILSHTLLRGTKTSFLLELPPYRRPQIGKILIRSFLDRTVFVLLRAVTVAIPAGILIFLLSHMEIHGAAITVWLSDFLDPLGTLMGLDGVILLAFLLGLPANEIVLPLCVMLYRANGVLSEIGSLSSLLETLTANGWTWQTAVCFLVFTVMHSPCATTLLTVKKETGKVRYMLLAFLIPTLCGVLLCMIINGIFHRF